MLTIFLLIFNLSWAQSAPSCPVTPVMINQLKAYMLCQSSPSIAACAGLGTGLAGRVVIRKPEDLAIPSLTEENLDAISEGLAEQIYDAEDTDGGKKASFKSLPVALQTFYFQQARRVVTRVLQRSALDQVDDYVLSFIMKGGIQFSKKYSAKIFTRKMVPLVDYVKDSVLNRSLMATTRATNISLANTTLTEGSALAMAEASGDGMVIFARILGFGAVAIGAAMDWFLMGGTGGCSSQYGLAYINTDDQCHPVYTANANVFKFLNLSDAEQRTLLDTPSTGVCNYYQNLHALFFTQPTFTSLTCSSQGFELGLRQTDGRARSLKAMYRYQTVDIKQINMDHTYPIEMDADASVRGIENSPTVADVVLPMKMYIMDAYDCCNTGNSDLRDQCLKAYNP